MYGVGVICKDSKVSRGRFHSGQAFDGFVRDSITRWITICGNEENTFDVYLDVTWTRIPSLFSFPAAAETMQEKLQIKAVRRRYPGRLCFTTMLYKRVRNSWRRKANAAAELGGGFGWALKTIGVYAQ